MADRIFRFLLGLTLVGALFFDLHQLITGVIALLLFEAVTNLRLTWVLASMPRGGAGPAGALALPGAGLDAERALRLIVAGLLAAGHLVWPETLWFLPWFIAFALTGAGLSGLCPMVLLLRGLGLR
jgi:hypothetical protein